MTLKQARVTAIESDEALVSRIRAAIHDDAIEALAREHASRRLVSLRWEQLTDASWDALVTECREADRELQNARAKGWR
jgi:hypothetical protein